MVTKTRPNLKAAVNAAFADNTTGAITAEALRIQLADLADSALFSGEGVPVAATIVDVATGQIPTVGKIGRTYGVLSLDSSLYGTTAAIPTWNANAVDTTTATFTVTEAISGLTLSVSGVGPGGLSYDLDLLIEDIGIVGTAPTLAPLLGGSRYDSAYASGLYALTNGTFVTAPAPVFYVNGVVKAGSELATQGEEVFISQTPTSGGFSKQFFSPTRIVGAEPAYIENLVPIAQAKLQYTPGIPNQTKFVLMASIEMVGGKPVFMSIGSVNSPSNPGAVTSSYAAIVGNSPNQVIRTSIAKVGGGSVLVSAPQTEAISGRVNYIVTGEAGVSVKEYYQINGGAWLSVSGSASGVTGFAFNGLPMSFLAYPDATNGSFENSSYAHVFWTPATIPDFSVQANLDKLFVGGKTTRPRIANSLLGQPLFEFRGDIDDLALGVNTGTLPDVESTGFGTVIVEQPPVDGEGTPPATPNERGTYLQPPTVARIGNPGVADPVIAVGLSNCGQGNPGIPFLDILQTGNIKIFSNTGFPTIQGDAVRSYRDASGWFPSLPANYAYYRSYWEYGKLDGIVDRTGRYRLRWTGDGTVTVSLGAKNVITGDHQIDFDLLTMSTFDIKWVPTNPANVLRLTSLVHYDDIARYDAGEVFRREWLDINRQARELRFMDWSETNQSTRVNWSDRIILNGHPGQGGALENQVALCNLLGCDGYFHVPHLASVDFIQKTVDYIGANLNANLKAKFAFSNEIWNFSFAQTVYANLRSKTDWAEGTFYAYTGKMQTVGCNIAKQKAIANGTRSKFVFVLETQAVNSGLLNAQLNNSKWQQYEPGAYIDAKTVFDCVAMTTYFNTSVVSNSASGLEEGTALYNAIIDPDTNEYIYQKAKLKEAIDRRIPSWNSTIAVATAAGLPMILYEGGQHEHSLGKLDSRPANERDVLRAFLPNWVRSPEMVEMYQYVYDWWKANGDGPWMQFGDVATPSKYGSWLYWEGLGRETLRGQWTDAINVADANWWGEVVNTRYQRTLPAP